MAKKLKRNYIQLVEGKKDDGTPIIETYLTPHHIPLDIWYEAVDVMEDLEKMEEENAEAEDPKSMSVLMKAQMDMLMDVVLKIYGKQFDKKKLRAGLHAPSVIEDLTQQVQFIAAGQQDDETKKFVESLS